MKKRILIIIASVAIILILIGGYLVVRGREIVIDPNTYYPVTYVLDGDTFKTKIKSKIITVRMLGIDTPETVDPRKPAECFGREASNEAKNILIGREVRFETNPNREQKDRYGRYLLYVYRDDGLFVNEHLIKGGFASEYTFGKPYSLQARFRALEADSMRTMTGLWGKCDVLH